MFSGDYEEKTKKRFSNVMDFFLEECITNTQRYHLTKKQDSAYLWRNDEDKSELLLEFYLKNRGIHKKIYSTNGLDGNVLRKFWANYRIFVDL